MRHLKAHKKLNRSPAHRLALLRNLSMALVQHERISTTVPKAKALRPFIEKLITLAKKGTLHHRRLLISRLGPVAHVAINPEGDTLADQQTIVQKLFDDIGPRFAERPGGYTRILKRTYRRLGDAGETCYIELLQEGEEKVRARAAQEAVAPAPQVEEEEEEEEEELEQEELEQEEEATEEASDEDDGVDDEEDDEEVDEGEEGEEDEKETSAEGDSSEGDEEKKEEKK
ncbi:MAG: 50S ribosomal protein L17 [Gemmataceae bacterium]